CLSFSNETVRELKKRLTLYGYVKRKQDFIGTVHGICVAEIMAPFQNLFPQFQIPNPIRMAPKSLVYEIYSSIVAETKFSEKDIPLDIINRERYISILGASQVDIIRNPLIQSIAEQLEKRLLESQHLDFVQITKIATQIIQDNDFVTKSL